MNVNGVCLVWNSLRPTDQHHGVPIPFLVRLALRQPKLSSAISACLKPLRAIGFNFILGADFGAVCVEAAASTQNLTYIGDHFAHGNHYEAPELLALEGDKTYGGSSFIRAGRMRQQLNEAAGQIDLDRCQQFLRDHANYPGSICAHLDPPDHSSLTKAAVVFVPAERAMYLSDGPPCGAPFVAYQVAATTAVA